MKFWKALVLQGFFVPTIGQSAFVTSELPKGVTIPSASLSMRSLGGSCLTQVGIQDGVPCAASLLALVQKPRFVATGLVGNGYEAIKQVNDVLYKPLSRNEIETLFGQKNHLEAEGSVRLTFLAPSFAAEFAPYQANLKAIVRNSSYPVIGVHAVNEKRLLFSVGNEIWNNVLIGSHLRLFQRRVVHDEFQMFQAVTNSSALLTAREQMGVALDPSVTWWMDHPWQWRATLAVENLTVVDRPDPLINTAAQWMAGVGASQKVGVGIFEFGVDWRPAVVGRVRPQEMSLGSSYRFGGLQLLAGINAERLSGGVRFALRNLDLGVSYNTTRWPSGQSDEYQQSLLTQVAVGF